MRIPFYRSVFLRMTAAVSLSFLIILSGSFFFLYSNVSDSLKERTDAEKIQAFHQLGYNIDTFRQDVEFLTERLISETVLTDLVFVGREEPGRVLSMKADYFRVLGGTMIQYEYVESICFYNAEGMALIMDGRQNVIQTDEEDLGHFYKERLAPRSDSWKSNPGGVMWFGGYTSDDFFPALGKNDGAVYYLSACRPIYWNSHLAWVVVNVNLDYFTDIYNSKEREDVQGELTYIVDEEGRIVSHPSREALGEIKAGGWRQGEGEGIYSYEEDGKQILCYPLEMAGWTMINEMPLEAILRDAKGIRVTFFATILVTILLALSLSVFWMERLARPLRETTEALRRMERGELEIVPLAGGESRDEIGLLVRQFNRMASRIEGLVEENAEMEENKHRLEIQALKAQLNPHFLYNTLNTVKWMATLKGEEDIADCVEALGDILRPMYQSSAPFWSLAEEIGYIEDYGKVMRYRYGEQIQLTLRQKEVEDARVPKFILQPIVENAFLYGRSDEDRALHICVTCRKEGEDLLLYVADDGEGIEQEALETLRKGISAGEETAHVGLSNVNGRIRLLCGDGYGLTIDSSPGEGTTVSIRLPYRGWESGRV